MLNDIIDKDCINKKTWSKYELKKEYEDVWKNK